MQSVAWRRPFYRVDLAAWLELGLWTAADARSWQENGELLTLVWSIGLLLVVFPLTGVCSLALSRCRLHALLAVGWSSVHVFSLVVYTCSRCMKVFMYVCK